MNDLSIVDVLCQRFMGLSPFEVMNAPLDQTYDLYVYCVLNDSRKKTNGNNPKEKIEWVNSTNANWH